MEDINLEIQAIENRIKASELAFIKDRRELTKLEMLRDAGHQRKALEKGLFLTAEISNALCEEGCVVVSQKKNDLEPEPNFWRVGNIATEFEFRDGSCMWFLVQLFVLFGDNHGHPMATAQANILRKGSCSADMSDLQEHVAMRIEAGQMLRRVLNQGGCCDRGLCIPDGFVLIR